MLRLSSTLPDIEHRACIHRVASTSTSAEPHLAKTRERVLTRSTTTKSASARTSVLAPQTCGRGRTAPKMRTSVHRALVGTAARASSRQHREGATPVRARAVTSATTANHSKGLAALGRFCRLDSPCACLLQRKHACHAPSLVSTSRPR